MIAGMIVNTSFLVREMRRSEQHDSFINAVTHELKTPVASIRLHLETLQRRALPEAQKQEFYSLMLSDTDRLTATVEQVLRAGRAGDRKAGRDKSQVDFRQLVRECMDAARTRHRLSEDALHYEEATSNGSGMPVLGNSEDLRTAVFNVLDNAIKYSGDHVDVRVRLAAPDEKRIVLSVQDHGVGIPADDLKSIFKRFYRVNRRTLAHVKGTGLGLFIVKSIAHKHGGRVSAASPEKGREPRLRWNCRGQPRDPRSGRRRRSPSRARLALQSGGRGLLRRNRRGWRIGHRAPPREERTFDAIVLDIMLPEKTASV